MTPELAQEMIAAIGREVPDYARPLEGPFGRALRVGVVDVVNKRPDQVSHLRGAVALALDRYHSSATDSTLVREARAVLDDAVRIMLGLGRKLYGSESSSASLRIKPAILLVDPNQAF